MAQRGKPSTAHEYDERNACIYCHMYRVNVERTSHVCTAARELEVDKQAALSAGVELEVWRARGYLKDGEWHEVIDGQ